MATCGTVRGLTVMARRPAVLRNQSVLTPNGTNMTNANQDLAFDQLDRANGGSHHPLYNPLGHVDRWAQQEILVRDAPFNSAMVPTCRQK